MKHLILTTALAAPLLAEDVFPGADENSPSRAHYFSWINNTNEGATIEHTEANMGFFQWLKDEYGMRLDIYAFDAGAVDAPRYYGSPTTRKFQTQFPDGLGPAARMAEGFGGRLGVWLGPDGFGDTDEEKQARIDFLVSLCRDDNVELFKMDAVCGQLRDEKQPALIELMKECRKHQPNLIMLNHRLNLGPAEPYATTFLWQGAETYIDVHMANNMTATHNRAKALGRGLPPELKRLAEDHGVCLSSCLDYWEDDLILQAFNRSMILAPQLYGSPWFLRDDEYPKLARIFNLHRRYRDILVKGMVLPEDGYGPFAVSRGDESTRLITLRNLTWEPVTYEVALDESVGLTADGGREARLFHPYEEILGKDLKASDKVKVTVYPFRAALLLASTKGCDEPSLVEGPYRVIKNVEGEEPVIEKLAALELKKPWHRKLADLESSDLPADWESLYEATVFAADNNALELRSLERSGPTAIPAVEKARQAFLDQPLMKARALSDRYMFDGNPATVFDTFVRNRDMRVATGALRIDFAAPRSFDRLAIHTQALDSTLIKNEILGAQFSQDLVEWAPAEELIVQGDTLNIYPPEGEWRYFRMQMAPERVAEIEAWRGGDVMLPRDEWRASNLFSHPNERPAEKSWSATVEIDEITPTSYLCVAIEGEHGEEGAYAALRVDGKPVGAPERAVSYPSNTWEYPSRRSKTGFTYYFPLDESHVGKKVDVVVLGMKDGGKDLKPHVWMTARELPFEVVR
ncbi:MAG: hypothetical protein ACPG4K_04525 [Haloferula sp.]